MKLSNNRIIGGDYFMIYKRKNGLNELYYYLDQFNEEDYWIYKATGRQRLVGSEWKEFKYSGYIFFKKYLYKKEDIDIWLNFLWSFTNLMYLNRPFPPIEIMKKISIIND